MNRKTYFNKWLAEQNSDGAWGVAFHRMMEPPFWYVDESDEEAGYQMDEEEAITTARRLNSMDMTPEDFNIKPTAMKPIPIKAAKSIANTYGYDQIIIIGRRVGQAPDPCGEHMTTYGVTPTHCSVIATAGHYLKEKVMNWFADNPVVPPFSSYEIVVGNNRKRTVVSDLELGRLMSGGAKIWEIRGV